MDLLVLVVLAALILVVVLAVQRKQPRTLFTTPVGRQDRSDAAAVQQWIALHDYAVTHGLRLLYVQRVYKRHPNGCKAQVSIYGDNGSTMRDAWFWRTQVAPGSVVAGTVSEGWGPHTRRSDVLFIGSQDLPGVYATLDAATVRRAQRHHHHRPQPPLSPPQH